MENYDVCSMEKALEDIEILLNAGAIKGVNFGETYKDMLSISKKCIEDKIRELKGDAYELRG